MSTITIDVPKWTENKYQNFIYSIVNNCSVSDLEDFMLWFHINNNKKNEELVSEEEVFNVFK